MRVVRPCSISLVIVAVALVGTASVAQANDVSVEAAIKAQDRAISQSPQVKRLLKTKKFTAGQAPKAIKLFQPLVARFAHAAMVVGKTTASTAQGQAGKSNWVKGVRGLAPGFSQLVTALKDDEHNNKTAAQTGAAAAVKTIANANALGVKAAHQLKLPIGS